MFVEVTIKSDNSKRLINSLIINYIAPLEESGSLICCFNRNDTLATEYRLKVNESYDELKSFLIKDNQ